MAAFALNDGKGALWQWDLDRKIQVLDCACSQVHFYNGQAENALVCEIFEEDGCRLANIPNILLQSEKPLRVYGFAEGNTLISQVFLINARPKPDSYIYTETECWTVEKAVADALCKAKENGDFKGDPGPKGDPGAVKFVVVAELPAEDTENAIYLLPAEGGEEENLFDEYIFVDGKWEKIGSTAVAVNLDEYVKSADMDALVKEAVTTNAETLTAEEKAAACEWMGALPIPAELNAWFPVITAVNTDGTLITYKVGSGQAANVIAHTDGRGCLYTAEPTQSNHTASKAYVDRRITANEDGTLTILLADGSKYKVNATKEET